MTMKILNMLWIILILVIILIRRYHMKKAGSQTSLKDTPALEAVLMLLWSVSACAIPVIFVFSDWLAFANYPFRIHWILKITGICIFILSIWLLHRSHVDLGRMWSIKVEPEKKGKLVEDGVYKRMRHPMYTAHLIWGVAQLLIFPNFIAGPSALIMFYIIIRLRIPREEKALMEQFGDDYKRYVLRTGCIFPRIVD